MTDIWIYVFQFERTRNQVEAEPLPPEKAIPPTWIKTKYICSRLLICGGPATLLATAAALVDFEADTRVGRADEEAAELVLVCVVVGGVTVGFGSAVVFGGVYVGLGGDAGAPPPKVHEPCNTPADSEAKKSKSPREKSNPAKGQPGHYA